VCGALAVLIAGALAGCAGGAPGAATTSPPSTAASGVSLTQQHPSMSVAQRTGTDLGPVPNTMPMFVRLGLAVRDQAGLDAVLASGTRLTPEQYAARFGPDPGGVASVQAALGRLGISAAWRAGETTLNATTAAAAVQRAFGVRLHRYHARDGVDFFAPVPGSAATVPAELRGVVTGVSGLDDYPRAHSSAIRSPRGVTPSDMVGFYDITPLRDRGIDGTGQTIYFIELDTFNQAAFNAFSTKFHLPAQQVTIVHRPEWGAPSNEEAESDLDLQVAHEIAPGAKLVVYQSGQGAFHAALKQIFLDHPGAVVSSSWGQCEAVSSAAEAQQYKTITDAAAAQGTAFFVASGDRGAYDCVPAGDVNTISADLDAGVPGVTSVGGTLAFLSSVNTAYYREAAWGEPVEQWGSSGGVSRFWPIPSWQSGPGVTNQWSTGKRQTPDVAANADAQSGWEVFTPKDGPVGGTSAAAPFWAAVAALVDSALVAKGLPTTGFANPVLYFFGRSPAGMPANPFHDITAGNNLYYPATPAWDYPTGLGSPDVAALADDWLWFAQNRPAGALP
jgi:kumamolisin